MRPTAVVLTLLIVIAYVGIWKAMSLEKTEVGKLSDELNSIFAGALLIVVGSGYAVYVTMRPVIAGICFL